MDVCSSCPLVDELICCRWEDGRGRRRLIGFITLEGYSALLYFSLMKLLVFVSGGGSASLEFSFLCMVLCFPLEGRF